MSEQTMIITTYGSIGVLIAASIYVIISLIVSKIKARKQGKVEKQAQIIKLQEYEAWRTQFHNNFVKIESEWNIQKRRRK